MDPMVAMFLSAQRSFGARVHAIGADQWHAPTPDSEWDVSALVEHLIDENRWLPPLARSHDLDAAGKIVEAAKSTSDGADLTKQFDVASVASAEAVQEQDVLDRTASLSRGPTPMREYLGEMIFDHLVHSWDLGAAIGYSGDPLPDDVVAAVYEMAKPMAPMLAGSGLFHDPVDVSDDAPTLDRLVALTGRDPNWKPS